MLYRHYKGDYYLKLFRAWIATNDQPRLPAVVYFSLRKLQFNVRDEREFYQRVCADGETRPRFRRIFPPVLFGGRS